MWPLLATIGPQTQILFLAGAGGLDIIMAPGNNIGHYHWLGTTINVVFGHQYSLT